MAPEGTQEKSKDLAHDRAIRLFQYLHAFYAQKEKPARDLKGFESVHWIHSFPKDHPDLKLSFCENINLPEDTWLKIKKPKRTPPPALAEALMPYLDAKEVEDSSRDFPQLQSLESHNNPKIKSAWNQYVRDKWLPWAKADRQVSFISELFNDFYLLHQKSIRLGEYYEMVWGLGLLAWQDPEGKKIFRHVLTLPVQTAFDAENETLTILSPPAAVEGHRAFLEQDMLDPRYALPPESLAEFMDPIAELPSLSQQTETLQKVLRNWFHRFSSKDIFFTDWSPPEAVDKEAKIFWAPALIVRHRSERGFLNVFGEILKQLKSTSQIPFGLKRLVEDTSDLKKTAEPEFDRVTPPEKIYFPLPANEEQRAIARKLPFEETILVQGPPGTGKSHTIVNLISHLLACGQKVLITSHTGRALKVLQKKCPKELAALCVFLLGDDAQSMHLLESNVQTITDCFNRWNQEKNQRDVEKLEERLEEARDQERKTLKSLKDLFQEEGQEQVLEYETHQGPYPPFKGTPRVIATEIKSQEKKYTWIKAYLNPDLLKANRSTPGKLPLQTPRLQAPIEQLECPLSENELNTILKVSGEVKPETLKELEKEWLDPEDILNPDQFSEMIQKERNVLGKHVNLGDLHERPYFEALAKTFDEKRIKLIHAIEDLLKAQENLQNDSFPWVRTAAKQIVAGKGAFWTDLLNHTRKTLESFDEREITAGHYKIEGLGNREPLVIKLHVKCLLGHLEGGKGLGVGPFRAKVVRDATYLIDEIRVNDKSCATIPVLRELQDYLELQEKLNFLRTHWKRHVDLKHLPFDQQIDQYNDLFQPLKKLLKLHQAVLGIQNMIESIPGLSEPSCQGADDLKTLQITAELIGLEEVLGKTRDYLKATEKILIKNLKKPNCHGVLGRILDSVRNRDIPGYVLSYDALATLKDVQEKISERQTILDKLRTLMPKFVENLPDLTTEIWQEQIKGFVEAWNWVRADSWLENRKQAQRQNELLEESRQIRQKTLDLTEQLAAKRAWRHCLSQLTPKELESLSDWADAISHIGRGKGKKASRFRHQAKKHMDQCRNAFPAWIMPLYRVAESIRPEPNIFDVAIIDEASQSGPEALLLFYLAKKVIVVGDDKQISPEYFGIQRETVEHLRKQYLSDIPHNESLGMESSFFDQAKVRFGQAISLQEHFRCLPPIIEFSNKNFYPKEPLIPLKPFTAARLDPTVMTQYVPEGFLEGGRNLLNPPEAMALVQQIKKCCLDPAYKEKTMGVISLQGSHQAKYIEKLLKVVLGPVEMERRKLACGGAYAFQGDERDVLFLSLVVAPTNDKKIGTLASHRDERRFNVAASRAKEQMWLFHSVTLEDLNPKCLRHKLLDYCLNPKIEPISFAGLDMVELRNKLHQTDRHQFEPPPPFKNWFEFDLYFNIVDQGYPVVSQYQIANYQVDLMVEGAQNRVAIACHGDFHDETLRQAQDLENERVLERCGWQFFRIAASTYYRHPQQSLKPLWQILG